MRHQNFLSDTLTTKQVCDLLGISRTTLYRARKSGLLEPVRIGRYLRYERKAIDDYVERLREENSIKSAST